LVESTGWGWNMVMSCKDLPCTDHVTGSSCPLKIAVFQRIAEEDWISSLEL
jgi:hypothetical protein